MARGIIDTIKDFLGDLPRGAIKAGIRRGIRPYLDALKRDGLKAEDIQGLVDNNISFYQNFMPQPWKQAIIEGLKPHASRISEIDEDTLILLIEAIGEELPWFPRVVTWEKRQWLINELELLRKDLLQAGPK